MTHKEAIRLKPGDRIRKIAGAHQGEIGTVIGHTDSHDPGTTSVQFATRIWLCEPGLMELVTEEIKQFSIHKERFLKGNLVVLFSTRDERDAVCTEIQSWPESLFFASGDLPTYENGKRFGFNSPGIRLRAGENVLYWSTGSSIDDKMKASEFLTKTVVEDSETKKQFFSGDYEVHPTTREEVNLVCDILNTWDLRTDGDRDTRAGDHWKALGLSSQYIHFLKPNVAYSCSEATRKQIDLAQFIKENSQTQTIQTITIMPKSREIRGTVHLKKAAIDALKEAGYKENGSLNPQQSLYINSNNQLVTVGSTGLGEGAVINLPADWAEIESLLANTEKTLKINGVTLTTKGVPADALFIIREHGSSVSRAELANITALFSERKRFNSDWGVNVESVKIGCTSGFTREHLDEVNRWVRSF